MKKIFLVLLIGGLAISSSRAEEAADSTSDSLSFTAEDFNQYLFLDSLFSALQFDSVGEEIIIQDLAKITVPPGYVFLNKEQSREVLVDAFGNVSTISTLGILSPIENGLLADSAGYFINIDYDAEGHVSDEDAQDIDYDELLQTMKEQTAEASRQRAALGYESIELVGWASEPYYDAATKKLHWAKELKFGTESQTTLNYDIRVLGREGYLNLNFVSGMDALEKVKEDIPNVLASAEFIDGNRYADFDPDTDKVATYGVAGLIAGGLALKTAAKVGIFAKLWKFLAIGAVAIAGFFRKMFGKKDKEEKPVKKSKPQNPDWKKEA